MRLFLTEAIKEGWTLLWKACTSPAYVGAGASRSHFSVSLHGDPGASAFILGYAIKYRFPIRP